jgi:hypothetical protein
LLKLHQLPLAIGHANLSSDGPQDTAISGYLRMFRAQKRAQGNNGVDETPLESSQHNEVANTPQISNTTSRHRPSSGIEAADDRGKPGSCLQTTSARIS